EDHITEKLDYEAIARESFSSSFHFQRVFSILCGYTLGEYIRYRRMTLAGIALAAGNERVIDVALKYGYDSPDSFAKAFCKFHGITPSQARSEGTKLKSFSRLSFKITLEGGTTMNYRIEKKPAMTLTGFKKRFEGTPLDRKNQDHNLWMSTRLNQYILQGMARDCATAYEVITNVGDDGYDFYIASRLGEWAMEHFEAELGDEIASRFEHLHLQAATYIVCETEKSDYPTETIGDLYRKVVTEWLPSAGYELADLPEIDVIHWYYSEREAEVNQQRYVELWLPITEKK
ncbi:MAG: helix-turn-helix domain-containing protein, partial [Clostridia bacterium]|nr:helix-turn-helix domain-containing protein [Clostridia bacterium]